MDSGVYITYYPLGLPLNGAAFPITTYLPYRLLGNAIQQELDRHISSLIVEITSIDREKRGEEGEGEEGEGEEREGEEGEREEEEGEEGEKEEGEKKEGEKKEGGVKGGVEGKEREEGEE